MRELLGFFSDASTPFQHNPTKKFNWTLTDMSKDDVVIYTDRKMLMPNKIGKKKIGIIYEPVEINQEVHNYIRTRHHEFDYIFTWDRELSKVAPNFIFMPYGTAWIQEEFCAVYGKTKMTSIIVSEKRAMVGHNLRHAAVSAYRSKIDLFGRGYNPIDFMIKGLADYRFNIVIENTNMDCNLSEKLITPFLCGTVPIYWGCPSVGDYFNSKGMFTFNTLEELGVILDSLTPQTYEDMLPYVMENFETAKKYQLVDDTIYNKLIELKLIDE